MSRVTAFAPSPTMRPSRTITAPNGPPLAPSTFSVASVMARRRNSGLGAEPTFNLLNSSPSGESKHSMAYAFRSTRVLTPRGLAPATLLVERERITGVCGWDEVPAVARLHDFGDYVLLPGLVDTHVHINEPGPHGMGRLHHRDTRRCSGRRHDARRYASELHAGDRQRRVAGSQTQGRGRQGVGRLGRLGRRGARQRRCAGRSRRRRSGGIQMLPGSLRH